MRSMASEDGGGDTHTTIQGKELYELEVRSLRTNQWVVKIHRKLVYKGICVNTFVSGFMCHPNLLI